MDSKKEKYARIGIATKGFVYCLIGILTIMAALGLGGKTTGSSGALESIAGGPFGKILLGLTILGLTGFIFWRMYQAFIDPEGKGSDAKGIARRSGYFFSGLFYGGVAFTAVEILFGSGGSSGGNQTIVAKMLGSSIGQYLVIGMALIFFGKAIYQWYRAFSDKFKSKVKESGLDKNARTILMNSGKVGYISRGVVVAIIGYMTLRAAITANSSNAGSTKEAFQFIQNEFGSFLLLMVSAGLFAYGVFMFVKARYRSMATN
ncbi:DUF1206 domain-containing protein [Marinigracilibium pacificum]|uniref:DUF1206 domain-containing protein n=1 Tax=Marinigracilibium pacificum TaxID=2729599 RepID=A0A848IYK9_9BACT|nr:DUF1206 domain-containing protein [Marinigracilibium pacificum]NMM47324.1 DUF1206 domain-containing protein [Marinigracilibium pacificum]